MKLHPFRIWNPWLRFAAVLVLVAMMVGVNRLGFSVGDPGVVSFFSMFAAIFTGSWFFRGTGEPVDPPRPWWQLTSRSRMSRAWGITAIVFAAVYAIGIAVRYLPPGPHLRHRAHLQPPTLAEDVTLGVVALQCVLVASLYLYSASRLRRREVVPTPAITTAESA